MLEEVKSRLESLGVNGDDIAVNFAIQKTETHIKHFCNIATIPECLNNVVIDMAVGDFLFTKKSMGQLKDFQIDQIVKKIQDGDTTVEYAATTDPESLFNSYVSKMIDGHNDDLIAHRKLRW